MTWVRPGFPVVLVRNIYVFLSCALTKTDGIAKTDYIVKINDN
ncbi:hypothetical protein VRK_39460 [Vibrio sp. MEBiC08052]|nr:hypothetical protein VRK_39460 [Vibrio sp. MEBiC08052]